MIADVAGAPGGMAGAVSALTDIQPHYCSFTLVSVLRVCEFMRFPVVWRGSAAGTGVTLADIMNKKKKKGLSFLSHSTDTHGKSTHTSPQQCDCVMCCVLVESVRKREEGVCLG